MPVPSIAFDPPYDIHILRGQVVDLTQLFEIAGEKAEEYVKEENEERRKDSKPGKLTYSFKPYFEGEDFESASEHHYQGLNIKVIFGKKEFTPTCIIDASADDPADKSKHIRNFLIEATLTDTADDESVRTYIRIHLHRDIKKIWISPETMTIYPAYHPIPYPDFTPSIHALFDDGTSAKINQFFDWYTNEIPVVYKPYLNENIKWTSEDDLSFKSYKSYYHTGSYQVIVRSKEKLKIGEYNLDVALKWNNTTHKASAKVIVPDTLSAKSPLKAELVAAGECPGYDKAAEVPNILFLPDGFTQEDSDYFSMLVENYVHALMKNDLTQPFKTLKKSINFWQVFIPSRERGATHNFEVAFGKVRKVREILAKGLKQFKEIPATQVGQTCRLPHDDLDALGDPKDWELPNMYAAFGYPTALEETLSEAELKKFFVSARGKIEEYVDNVFEKNKKLVETWQKLGHRRRIEEPDTALGLTINDFCTADDEDDNNYMGLNANKLSRLDLNEFLAGLKDSKGNPIGQFFVKHPFGELGKDYDRIVVISAAINGRELNEDGVFFIKIAEPDRYFINEQDKKAERYHLHYPLVRVFDVEQKAVLTHEMAHSFGLEDEYGEPGEGSTGDIITDELAKANSFARYLGDAADMDWSANVQARDDLFDADNNYDPYLIKWRYHRIKAARMVEKVEVKDDLLSVTLKGDSEGFAKNQVAFLRKRSLKNTYFLRDNRGISMKILSEFKFPSDFDQFVDKRLKKGKISKKGSAYTMTVKYKDKEVGDKVMELPLAKGYDKKFKKSKNFRIHLRIASPIVDVTRNENGFISSLSQTMVHITELTKINDQSFTALLKADTGKFDEGFKKLNAELINPLFKQEEMILYLPIPMSDATKTTAYPYKELIAKKILDHLKVNPAPFNAKKIKDTGKFEEMIDNEPISSSSIPKDLVPKCSRRKREIVGFYAGGNTYHSHMYHPCAECMMRDQTVVETKRRFLIFKKTVTRVVHLCAVCRYALVNQIDPSKHAELDKYYAKRKIYPE
jgi:hypothetical protein